MSLRGHNENAVRLSMLADGRIAKARADIASGWIDFGAAMSEAAALCGSASQFNVWFKAQEFKRDGRCVSVGDRDAAMWASQNPDAFREGLERGYGTTPQAAMKWALRACRADVRDFIYVMTNPSMPGMVKVGMTKCSPELRAKQISQNSGVPTPFVVFSSFRSARASHIERRVHSLLSNARVSENREFFAVNAEQAVTAITAAIQEIGGQ